MSELSDELKNFLNRAQQEIEGSLRTIIAPASESIANLDDGLAYSLGLDDGAPSHGKRIRPALCLLVCHALCGRTAPALPFATAIELMHNFCLVHDDIEDGDEFRRGRPAVWKQYGLSHAINIGDYLFTKIFASLLRMPEPLPEEKQLRLFSLMGDTLDHTHRGQALDMNARNSSITISSYMHLVREKTGYYLAAPLVAGAIAAGADGGVEEALKDFGLLIGPLFQIRDDVIDLTHGKGREAVGSDVREGKRSFLVAHVLEQAPHLGNELMAILDLSRAETTQEHVFRALAIFQESGALEAASATCDGLRKQALAKLEQLPQPLRQWLLEITTYLVERTA